MSVLQVPYHLDEYLPELDLPLRADAVITAPLPSGSVWDRLAALFGLVADEVHAAARGGDCPVVVSGDCLTAVGTVAGLQRAGVDLGIVWLDAHGDVQTLETSTSGYLGGLPLRLLTGYRPELIAARLGLVPVAEDRVVLAGARDLDPPEAEYLASAPVHRLEVPDLSPAVLPGLPLYVHLDVDVADPADIPGLRYPAPGGPGLATVAGALSGLLATGRVAAVGIACSWSPGHGAAAATEPLLKAALSR